MKKLLLAAVALAIATPASAVTVDPYAQLNSATPTVGSFVFGTVNPGTGTITPLTPVQRPCSDFPGVTCARGVGTEIPVVYASTNPLMIDNVTIPNDRILLHPGSGIIAGLGFVASLTGTYNFFGEFSDQQIGGNGVTTGAFGPNGAFLFSSETRNLSSGPRAFNFNASLTQGQTVNFFVGDGGDANSDNTGLFLRVSDVADVVAAVPEPSTWLMMILGFGLVGGTLRSRRRVKAGLAAA